MTTPQRTFSEANQAGKETGEPIRLTTGRSIYSADCLCGRHFETSSGEWVCPDCHRQIVLDWALWFSEIQMGKGRAPGAVTGAFPNQAILSAICQQFESAVVPNRCSQFLGVHVGSRSTKGSPRIMRSRWKGRFRFSGDPALVAMVQATNFRYRNNGTQFDTLYRSRFRTIFLQG